MLGHASDTRFVEQVAAVRQAATQTLIKISDFKVQIEFGRQCIVDQIVHGHPGQGAALLEFPALHVAHHLEQWVIRCAARRLQCFHQMIERQVLIGLAFNHGLTHLVDELGNAHLPIELTTQHLSIEERTDQPFAFRTNTVGHWRADAQVLLTAVAIEQDRQCCRHGHEQGQAMLGVELTHLSGQFVAQIEAVKPATMALHRRTRPITGQFQQRVFTAQFCGPVIQLSLALTRLQPLPLPDTVIQILHRQRLER